MPARASTKVERLPAAALSECLALAVDRDWTPEAHKWELLFTHGEVWGIRGADGALVGTAAATRFGDVVAIGNVLVARSAERQGVGGALMRHVLQRHHDAVHILNATTFGEPLYEKLGFVAVGRTHTHRGIFLAAAAAGAGAGADAGADAETDVLLPVTRPATLADLPTLVEFDASVYGAERAPLIRTVLTSFADKAFVVHDAEGAALAFGACWNNHDNAQVGPLLGHSEHQIRALIASLAQGVAGTFRVDLNDRDSGLRAWATARGLLETGSSTLMVHGASALPGDRRRWYSALMQAIG